MQMRAPRWLKGILSIHPARACCVLASLLVAAPAAQAQATGYDTSLRSIGPASMTQANLDGRTRTAVQSIGPVSLENRAATVPAVFDPSTGRFVSALGNVRGAIATGSSGAVSVTIANQQSAFIVNVGSSSSSQRSESLASPSATVAVPQIMASPSNSAR